MGVPGHGLDNLLGIGAAVHPRLPHLDPVLFQSQICLLKCLGLNVAKVESRASLLAMPRLGNISETKVLHIGVAVPVLHEEWVAVDLGNAGKVSESLLVRELGIILLGGNELVSSSTFFGSANQSGLFGVRTYERLS